MAHVERPTYQLQPGDTILVHHDKATGQVWPAIAAHIAEVATVRDPALLSVDPPWYDDTVLLGTLNTSVGPCLVDLTYRWLLPEPAVTQLRLLGSTGWDAARPA
jgi:hypothetical protein